NDQRWTGDPFRRVIASVLPTVPAATAAKLLGWARPYVERDPGGLRWVATVAGANKILDPISLLEEATRKPTATADDWLCLALARKPEDLNAAKAKLTPNAYLAAAAVLLETSAGKEFSPETASVAEKRQFAQARLAVKLSLGKSEDAAKVLEA